MMLLDLRWVVVTNSLPHLSYAYLLEVSNSSKLCSCLEFCCLASWLLGNLDMRLGTKGSRVGTWALKRGLSRVCRSMDHLSWMGDRAGVKDDAGRLTALHRLVF